VLGRTNTHVADKLDVLQLRALHTWAHPSYEGDPASEPSVTALDDLAVCDLEPEPLRVLGLEDECLPDLGMAEHGRRAGRVDRRGEGGGEREGHRDRYCLKLRVGLLVRRDGLDEARFVKVIYERPAWPQPEVPKPTRHTLWSARPLRSARCRFS
jgi:hypothetical protein